MYYQHTELAAASQYGAVRAGEEISRLPSIAASRDVFTVRGQGFIHDRKTFQHQLQPIPLSPRYTMLGSPPRKRETRCSMTKRHFLLFVESCRGHIF